MSTATATAVGEVPALRVFEPKLMPPRVHPGMVRRGRLLEVLDETSAHFRAWPSRGRRSRLSSMSADQPEI